MITNADMNKILQDINVILDKLDKRITTIEENLAETKKALASKSTRATAKK